MLTSAKCGRKGSRLPMSMGIGPSHAFSRKAIDVEVGNQPSGRGCSRPHRHSPGRLTYRSRMLGKRIRIAPCARMSGWQAVPTMRMVAAFPKAQPVALGEHGFNLTSLKVRSKLAKAATRSMTRFSKRATAASGPGSALSFLIG